MYSLSTAWNSVKHKNGYDIVNEIKSLGFDTIELNFALTETMVLDILKIAESSGIKVSSLHNICPLPKEVEPDEASPDYYSLAAADEEERKLAVEVTKNTIDFAKRFGAKAVVLHAGRVPIKDKTRPLAVLADDRQAFDKLKAEMIKERSEKKNGYLDNVIRSLGELVPYARDAGLSLGIENRYYYREIPLMEEIEIILKTFKSPALGYWHDVGHAEVFERLGLVRHRDLLEKFANRLIGLHLHDIIGLTKDHNAPGYGTFDFSIVKPYVTQSTVKVIEAHQPATADQIRRSVKYLDKVLG